MFDVTFTIVDAYGRTTSRRYQNNRTTIADAGSDAAAMVTLLEAMTLSAVSKYAISQPTVIASPSPETGANNDAGGTLHCRMDNSKLVGLKVPAIDPDVVISSGEIDIDDASVVAFVGAFATGEHWRISEGNYITSIVSGELDK